VKDSTFSLPMGWVEEPLHDVAEINPILDKTRFADDLEVSFVPMPAVEATTGSIDVSETRQFSNVKKGYTAFRERDVLFAKITPCMENGKMAIAPDLVNDLGFGSTEFHVIRPHNGVVPEYIYYFVSSQQFRYDAEHNMTGAVGQRRVPAPYLSKYLIPVPPTKTQHRIVAKIEELFSELDKGIESLKTAREQLKVYRQAILKHAFEGKLTAQWREDNKDELETADQLLPRIQKERETHHKQQLEEWKDAAKAWEENGREDKKPRKPKVLKPLPKPTVEELDELFELPESWTWIRPEIISAPENYAIGIGPFGSNLKVSDYRKSGVPLIFVRNITRSDFSRDLKYIDRSKYLELIAHSVKPLDLLITKRGDPPGDCEIYPDKCPDAVLTADCLKFRLWEKYVDRRFYRYCINSNLARKQLGLITKGVAQKKISTGRFKTILLPFLCLDEQQVIADHLDQLFSVSEQQEQVILQSLQKSETLRQSILKKAFSGQLVEQDPNDEPASVLLERIKAEKAVQAKDRKRIRKPKARRKEAI
jgi:type I restriction enzyme S subunit